MRWGQAECERRQQLTTNPEALRTVLEPIIPLVRFPLMSSVELAQYVLPTNILSSDAMSLLLGRCVLREQGVATLPPVPGGFSEKPRRTFGFTWNRQWTHPKLKIGADNSLAVVGNTCV